MESGRSTKAGVTYSRFSVNSAASDVWIVSLMCVLCNSAHGPSAVPGPSFCSRNSTHQNPLVLSTCPSQCRPRSQRGPVLTSKWPFLFYSCRSLPTRYNISPKYVYCSHFYFFFPPNYKLLMGSEYFFLNPRGNCAEQTAWWKSKQIYAKWLYV